MEPLVLIAFRDELQKIAGVSLDAGSRALIAERAGKQIGKDYLAGGELESNDTAQTNFVPKTAAGYGAGKFESATYKKYKKYREPGASALKGGLAGSFVGNILGPERMGKNPIRAGALIGGGLGLADWIASGRARRWTDKARRRRAVRKTKKAMIGSETFTPGRALSQTRSVGRFQDKLVHKGDRLRPMKIGEKFSIPADPGE